ncbi:MAG: fibronectin type III domain-containing protein [Deltaproteobacteria bacterium]|nr:fibronectin type III domain-containing protein [Deltaproteobacteria bacterium]
MGLLTRLLPLIPLLLSLFLSISFGQIVRDPQEKDIKNLFFNPKVGSEEIRKVVVLPIHSEGETVKHAPRMTDLLVAGLKTVQKYEILPAQDLKDLVEIRGIDWMKIHHYTLALEIGKSLGVDGVLMASLSEYGPMGERARFGLNLRMIRIPDGDTVWSMSCSARGKSRAMEKIAKEGIESVIRTLAHRWQLEKATTAWGIKLQPLEASGRYSHIILRVPEYRETEIKEYIVSRSNSEAGPYKEIKRLSTKRKASLSFKDGEVREDRTYFYRYRVLTKKGFMSSSSKAVEAGLGLTPTAPTGLSAIGGKIREIRLTWGKSTAREVAGYKIYRSEHPDRDYRLVASVKNRDKTLYVDKGSSENPLGDAIQYFYRITAFYPSGNESERSGAASATTKGKPSIPRGAMATSDVIRKIPLSWIANPGPEVKGYRIYRSLSKDGPYRLIGKVDGRDKTSFVDSQGLRDKTGYYYRITAINVAGVESDPTTPFSATTRGIPLPPEGLKAVGGMLKSILIEWTPPPDPEVRGQVIYRSPSPEGPFAEIQRIKGTKKNSFLDGRTLKKKLADGTLYYYKMRSYNKVDVFSEETEVVFARTKKAPQAPTGISALEDQPRKISLSWKSNPEKDIKHYLIYRSEGVGKRYRKVASKPGDKTDFIDTKLADGTTYSYRVKAVDVDGLQSEFSEIISATTKAVPSRPKGIKAEGGKGKITISWEANPEDDIARYHIYRKTPFGFRKIGSTNGISYTDEKLKDGKTYTYKVSAVDRDGLESPFSKEISPATAPK